MYSVLVAWFIFLWFCTQLAVACISLFVLQSKVVMYLPLMKFLHIKRGAVGQASTFPAVRSALGPIGGGVPGYGYGQAMSQQGIPAAAAAGFSGGVLPVVASGSGGPPQQTPPTSQASELVAAPPPAALSEAAPSAPPSVPGPIAPPSSQQSRPPPILNAAAPPLLEHRTQHQQFRQQQTGKVLRHSCSQFRPFIPVLS